MSASRRGTFSRRQEVGALALAEQSVKVRPLLALLDVLEKRYPDLAGHGEVVGGYAAITGEELGLSDEMVDCLMLAGTLHDLGKLVLDEDILREPGPLDEVQWREVMRHPELGADLLAASNLDEIARWVLAHHERPDGHGYPFGLDDAEIPLEAKIITVADSYDAMRTDRIYRSAMSDEQAVEELHRGTGTQFDAAVVEAFLRALASL
jgi:HD-GYP domain-containing protein (c-di-GMP phosphodiesterase class II)